MSTETTAEHALPNTIDTVEQLEEVLSQPTPGLIEDLPKLEGDIMVLGVAGKMGPALARQARRALDASGATDRQIIGVSRFSTPGSREALEDVGVNTISADLLDAGALASLPDVPNIIFMVGRKFGSTGDESFTWAMNTWLPGLVAQRYPESRISVFSTQHVYPLSPVGRGLTESDPAEPIGEYAQSCLGRERIFQYFSHENGTPVTLIRMGYAQDLRYGTLYDVAHRVFEEDPVPLSMGVFNVMWQGDCNAAALRSLTLCASPPEILVVTGPETVSVRWAAEWFGEKFGREPVFEGEEQDTALQPSGVRCHQLFGYPQVSLIQIMEWIAHWLTIAGEHIHKPTHFDVRDGRF